MKIITADRWVQSIAEQLNLDPSDVRRVVIDAVAGDALMVYVEKYGTERMLEVKLPSETRVEIR